MTMQRFGQSLIIVFSALATLGGVAWLTLLDHGGRWWIPLSVCFIVAAPALITAAYIRHDLLAERGRALGEMAASGYLLCEEDAPIVLLWGLLTIPHVRRIWWIDRDGDGEIDEGELRPAFQMNDYRQDKQDPAVRQQRLRNLLQWCHERQRTGDGFDQGPGRAAYGKNYDGDMNELARRGFLQARSTGHTGRLTFDDQAAALVAFDGQREE